MRVALIGPRVPSSQAAGEGAYSACVLELGRNELSRAARVAAVALSRLRRTDDSLLVVGCGSIARGRELERRTFPGVPACPLATVAEVEGVDDLAAALVAHPETNETLFAAVGSPDRVVAAVRDGFVPDMETTPVNEELVLPDVTTIVTRGNDARSFTLMSRVHEPEELAAALHVAASDCGVALPEE